MRRSGLANQRIVPLLLRAVPLDELPDTLPNIHGGFVAEQSVGLRYVGLRTASTPNESVEISQGRRAGEMPVIGYREGCGGQDSWNLKSGRRMWQEIQ